MKDTPDHVQEIHLQIWLSKTPGERLLQALKNNEQMFLFSKEAKKAMDKLKGDSRPKTDS